MEKLIQIRGTSGSGKTWVMNQLLEKLGPFEPSYIPKRKKPLFYSNSQDVVILGHYESACGGCDNIGSAAKVYELIMNMSGGTFHGNERTFICEGLLLSEDTKWTLKLNSALFNTSVYYLSTDIESCIQQIISRRKEAGNEEPLNESNTRNRVRVIERSKEKLVNYGVYCRRCSSSQAVKLILEKIRAK